MALGISHAPPIKDTEEQHLLFEKWCHPQQHGTCMPEYHHQLYPNQQRVMASFYLILMAVSAGVFCAITDYTHSTPSNLICFPNIPT